LVPVVVVIPVRAAALPRAVAPRAAAPVVVVIPVRAVAPARAVVQVRAVPVQAVVQVRAVPVQAVVPVPVVAAALLVMTAAAGYAPTPIRELELRVSRAARKRCPMRNARAPATPRRRRSALPCHS
jgi:hypothetical protein